LRRTKSNFSCCHQRGIVFIRSAEVDDAAVKLKLIVASDGIWPVSVHERFHKAKMRTENRLHSLQPGLPAKYPEFQIYAVGEEKWWKVHSEMGDCAGVRGGGTFAMRRGCTRIWRRLYGKERKGGAG
jgi:hypothetical protein